MVAADGENMPLSRSETPQPYPLLALKNIVVFPHTTTKINVGRPRSLDAIEQALARDTYVVASMVKRESAHDLVPDEVHAIGTLCRIKEHAREDGCIQVTLEGVNRVRILGTDATTPYVIVRVEEVHEHGGSETEHRAWARHIREQLTQYARLHGSAVDGLLNAANAATDIGCFAVLVATIVTDLEQKQALLSEPNTLKRLETLATAIAGALDVAEWEQKITERVREQIDKNPRERQAMGALRFANEAISDAAGNVLVSRDAMSREAWDALVFVATTASDPVIDAVLVILAARTTAFVLSVDEDVVVIGGKVITRAATPDAAWPIMRVLPLLTAGEVRAVHKACVLHLHAELP